MRHKLIFSLLLSVSLFTGLKPAPTAAGTEYVYICEGPYSNVYHKAADCRGLSNCSTKVYKMTLEEAQRLNRRPCKIEYP